MVRGVVIFSAGIAVGYGIAMSRQDPNNEIKTATVDFIRTMKSTMADAYLDAKSERMKKEAAQEAENTEKAPDSEEPTSP